MWYAQILVDEKKEDFKYNLSLAEYLASFWNSEAVQKIRANREMQEDERFASDEEFEEQLQNKDFIKESDDLVKSIRDKYKHTNLQDKDRPRERVVTSPEDMSGLFRAIKKR